MENSTKPLWQVSLNYGLITGLVVIIFSLILYLLDFGADPSEGYINLVIYLIMIGGMIWGAKNYRDQHNGGFATYGQAFLAAFLVALFAAIINSVYTYVIYTLDPGLIDKAVLLAEEQMYERGMSGEQMEQALAVQKRFMNPLLLALLSFLWITIIDAVLALILAIFIKREDPSLQTGV